MTTENNNDLHAKMQAEYERFGRNFLQLMPTEAEALQGLTDLADACETEPEAIRILSNREKRKKLGELLNMASDPSKMMDFVEFTMFPPSIKFKPEKMADIQAIFGDILNS